MPDLGVLTGLINLKVEKVLKIFLKNKNKLFHINDLAEKSGVPLATTFRIIKKLLSLDIIVAVEIGKFKAYKLSANGKNKVLMRYLK